MKRGNININEYETQTVVKHKNLMNFDILILH